MVKKLMSLILTALLLVTPLAGCGAQTSKTEPTASAAGEKVVIRFWGHQNPVWNDVHKKQATEYEAKNPNVKIEFEFFPYDDFEAKVQTSLMSGDQAPDIYELWGGWAIDFSETGKLSKVPDKFVADLKNDCYEPVLGSFQFNGDYYGVPEEYNIEYGGLLVNKTLFNQKSLSYPTTWDGMINLAKQNSVKNGEIMDMRGLDFVNWDTVPYTWLAMLMSQGASYYNQDGSFNFTSPEAVDAMEKLVSYVKVDGVANLDGLLNSSDGEGYIFVYQGNALMAPRGPWVIPEGEVSFGLKYGQDYDYIAIPWYGGTKSFAAETGWGLSVAESSKQKDAAWGYVEYLLLPDVLLQHDVDCSMIPPRKSVANNAAYLDKAPYAKPLIPILEDGHYIGRFNTDVFKEAVNNLFVELCTTDTYASAKDGLTALEADLNSKLIK